MNNRTISKIGMWTIISIACFFGILWIFFPSLNYDKLIGANLDQWNLSAICLGISVIGLGLILLFALGNITPEPSISLSMPLVAGGIESALRDYYYLTNQRITYYSPTINKLPAPNPHPDRAIFQKLAECYSVDADELEHAVRNISDCIT